MQKDYKKGIFSVIEQNGIDISDEMKNKIERKIDEILSYEPRIGIFGKTGVGKSSLCNALFGQDVCPISDIEACTRNPQDVFLSIGKKGLKLLDVPGVGESDARDIEYASLYQSLLPELDVVFWVLKADDRAFSSDEIFYKKLVRPHMDQGKPFFIVLNQVDKIEPFREWDEINRRPGEQQLLNIRDKIRAVSTFFDLPMHKVIPVSANEKYGLVELIDAMIFALPNDKKATVIPFVAPENISKEARESSDKGMFQTIIDVACEFVPALKPIVNIGKKVWNFFFGD